MIDVTIEQLHAEACQALGEAIVAQRILAQRCQQLEADNADLRSAQPGQ